MIRLLLLHPCARTSQAAALVLALIPLQATALAGGHDHLSPPAGEARPGDPGPAPAAGGGSAAGGAEGAISPGGEPFPSPAATPASAFATFRGLAGTWVGRSTKGWTEEVTIKAIAGGSVVVVSSFDAHPGEEMLTTYFLDGDELQLKHFCIAGNQPRLAATSISKDGSEITFTFRDATGLPSRDHGHMDKVVYRFHGPDSFTSRWTWYQDGKESWMEEIEYRRAR